MEEERAASDLSNDCLKEAFRQLHETVVANIRATSIIDTLFSKKVITAHDVDDLSIVALQRDKCRRLLILLHTSTNPYAFVELRSAIWSDSTYHWLVEDIDKKARSNLVTLPLLSPVIIDRKATESLWPPEQGRGLRRYASAAGIFHATATGLMSPVIHMEEVVMRPRENEPSDSQRHNLSWNCGTPRNYRDDRLVWPNRLSDNRQSKGWHYERMTSSTSPRPAPGHPKHDPLTVPTEAVLAVQQQYFEDRLRQQQAESDKEKEKLRSCIKSLKATHEEKIKEIERLSGIFSDNVSSRASDRVSTPVPTSEIAEDKEEQWPRPLSNPLHVSLIRYPIGAIAPSKGELFVVRLCTERRIEVYDTTTFELTRKISIRRLGEVSWGLATSASGKYLFVSDWCKCKIHRIKLCTSLVSRITRRRILSWRVGDGNPMRLSISISGNMLVTFWNHVHEYDTRGTFVRKVTVHRAPEVGWLQHAIELDSGDLVVSAAESVIHRVCLTTRDGQIKNMHGNERGSASGQLDNPSQLAVDRNGFVLVADSGNDRIVVLNPTLTSARQLDISIRNSFLRGPCSIHVDRSTNRLYVAESRGRFLVFDLSP